MPPYDRTFLAVFMEEVNKANKSFNQKRSKLNDLIQLLGQDLPQATAANTIGTAVDHLRSETKLKYRDAIRYLEATYPGLLAWRGQHPLQQAQQAPTMRNVYLVGHGNWQPEFGQFAVPARKAVRFYVKDGGMVDDSFERVLLSGGTFNPGSQASFWIETIMPGKSCKDYHVHNPGNLRLTKRPNDVGVRRVDPVAISAANDGDYFYVEHFFIRLSDFVKDIPNSVVLHCLFCRDHKSDEEVHRAVAGQGPIWPPAHPAPPEQRGMGAGFGDRVAVLEVASRQPDDIGQGIEIASGEAFSNDGAPPPPPLPGKLVGEARGRRV